MSERAKEEQSQEEWDAAWEAEIKRRVENIRTGKVKVCFVGGRRSEVGRGSAVKTILAEIEALPGTEEVHYGTGTA